MTTVETPVTGRQSGRLAGARWLLTAAATVVFVALLVWLGWTWRHPTAFNEYSTGRVSHRGWSAGQTAYIGMSFPDNQISGSVTIHGAEPHQLRGDGVTLEYYVCTPDGNGGIGLVGDAEIPTTCSEFLPADGTSMSPATQQLVVAVMPRHPGVVAFHGINLRYSRGWQNGTQHVGLDVRIRVTG